PAGSGRGPGNEAEGGRPGRGLTGDRRAAAAAPAAPASPASHVARRAGRGHDAHLRPRPLAAPARGQGDLADARDPAHAALDLAHARRARRAAVVALPRPAVAVLEPRRPVGA